MKELIYLSLSLCILTVIPAAAGFCETIQVGMCAKEAITIRPLETPDKNKSAHVSSPDKRYLLEITGAEMTISASNKTDDLKPSPVIYLDSLAEVGWSEDSSSLFLTRSDGGWIGSWYVRVMRSNDNWSKEIDITQDALEDYQRLITRCPEEIPNVVAVGWVGTSDQLLIVVETPNHSSCPDMGNIEGYLVAVPSGKVIQRYDHDALRKQYSHLMGQRLLSKYEPNR
jgi:hypothetical protein